MPCIYMREGRLVFMCGRSGRGNEVTREESIARAAAKGSREWSEVPKEKEKKCRKGQLSKRITGKLGEKERERINQQSNG